MMADYSAFTEGFTRATPTSTARRSPADERHDRAHPRRKRVITDGPFAETKELLGGYYMVDARRSIRRSNSGPPCPAATFGSIEVRPLAARG